MVYVPRRGANLWFPVVGIAWVAACDQCTVDALRPFGTVPNGTQQLLDLGALGDGGSGS